MGDGEVDVLDSASGLPLKFAYSGDLQRAQWTVCTAVLTHGSFNEPGWLVTVEIADPRNGCNTESQGSEAFRTDPYGEDKALASEAEDETGDGTSNSTNSGPERGVHPGSWCGNQGAYGYTSAGTRMQCQYGKGNDHRWRRAP
ncbi:hypothetical protein [Streptomyces sp. NBC_01800]|uniref:hypothetical protein n=1 Tax=Streptomyces sp. NBC_01800 TaxID=2975945 RepID=UPI002DD94388|nr:hypothetical protein [Streptomyces sp. NBC_01800]WSA65569.1 hypothetical protein OIE65_00065 [Streptomyces sp. NBC_01800]WSA73548.1 hypothetical protein OIE65_45995 [Streptomyces sp. NBC_01800]